LKGIRSNRILNTNTVNKRQIASYFPKPSVEFRAMLKWGSLEDLELEKQKSKKSNKRKHVEEDVN